MKYFISDTHFFHKNIIKFSNRPFDDVEQMNNQIIHNWNAIVTKQDEVYILGDFVVHGSGEHANNILEQLNGVKYLIKGNHEDYLDDPNFDTSHFKWIKDYHTFEHNNITFVLFHYPILEWDHFYNDSIHLFGHVHHKKKEYLRKILGPRAINVGVDVNNFFPINIDRVLKIVKSRENQ